MVKSNLLSSFGTTTRRALRNVSTFALWGRNGLLLGTLLLWGVSANATSQCWQWRGVEAGLGVVEPYENSPAQAFNDVVAYCNSAVCSFSDFRTKC